MLLLEKIRSEKAVEAAGLAGLSYCPHCSFGCVIDNPGTSTQILDSPMTKHALIRSYWLDEKLFYCFNEECKKITCRQCQKPDHLPKTCDEYAADLKTDTIHRVEEAMTEALLKRCPHCTTPVLKEDGVRNVQQQTHKDCILIVYWLLSAIRCAARSAPYYSAMCAPRRYQVTTSDVPKSILQG